MEKITDSELCPQSKDDSVGEQKKLLLQTLEQTFPPYTWDMMDIEQLQEYLQDNKDILKKYVDSMLKKFTSKEELLAYLYQSDYVTPYQKKMLHYIEKRSKNLPLYVVSDSNATNAHMSSKSVKVWIQDVVICSAFGNMSLDAGLALLVLHEYNHIFNNFSEYMDGVWLMLDEEDEKDALWKSEQQNAKKTEKRYNIAKEYQKNNPYKDFFRFGEDNRDYIINSKDEFLTESVSNEHFMEWLSHIPHNNNKSRFDKIIRENTKESWISIEQNTLLYTLLDFYYGNINNQARKLENKDLWAKFFAYQEREE